MPGPVNPSGLFSLRLEDVDGIYFENVSSRQEAEWLANKVAEEKELLDSLLARNHQVMVQHGIGAKVTALNDHLEETANVEIAEYLGVSVEGVRHMEGGGSTIKVTETTQFRVAENIGNEAGDGEDVLYVVTYNGPGSRESSPTKVGRRWPGAQGDTYDFVLPDIPSNLHLSLSQLMLMGSFIDKFNEEIAAGRLPHLYPGGTYDTLIVPGLSATAEELKSS